jgi:RNase P subunit RPR2
MGKAKRPSKKNALQQEACARVRFLTQAAALMTCKQLPATVPRVLNVLVKRITARLNIRLDAQTKKSICRRCGACLLPGTKETKAILSDSHPKALILVCLSCRYRGNKIFLQEKKNSKEKPE